MTAPTTSTDFDRAYRGPFTFWGDVRIPDEIKALIKDHAPKTSLELGCGIGRFSRYSAQQGVRATAVDFSAVAIEKAKARVAADALKPDYRVGDVTRLGTIDGPFDVAFDVGCFHCFEPDGQRVYAAEVARLLRPGGTLLIWGLDATPSDLALTPAMVREVFGSQFELTQSQASRRRLARSHWYWLTRRGQASTTPS